MLPSTLDPFCDSVWLGRVSVCFSGDLIRIAQASGPSWLLSRMSSSPKEQPAGDGAFGPLTLVCSERPLVCFEPYWEHGVSLRALPTPF